MTSRTFTFPPAALGEYRWQPPTIAGAEEATPWTMNYRLSGGDVAALAEEITEALAELEAGPPTTTANTDAGTATTLYVAVVAPEDAAGRIAIDAAIAEAARRNGCEMAKADPSLRDTDDMYRVIMHACAHGA